MEHTTASDFVGIVSANNIPDKMEKAGFTTVKSQYVNAPIINELPLTLECVLKQELDGGKFSTITYDPVHDGYYRLDEHVGNAFKDGEKLK